MLIAFDVCVLLFCNLVFMLYQTVCVFLNTIFVLKCIQALAWLGSKAGPPVWCLCFKCQTPGFFQSAGSVKGFIQDRSRAEAFEAALHSLKGKCCKQQQIFTQLGWEIFFT